MRCVSKPNRRECVAQTKAMVSCAWSRSSSLSEAPVVEDPATNVPERLAGSPGINGSLIAIRTTGLVPWGATAGRRRKKRVPVYGNEGVNQGTIENFIKFIGGKEKSVVRICMAWKNCRSA